MRPSRRAARRAARRFAGARRGEICRGLLLREIRRHPCAGDRDAGRPAAALAQGPGARLGHRRIRHAAARHARAHAPRGLRRQAGRPHRRDPAADRPQPALGRRSAGARRAADHRRLRRHPGRRRHPHRRDHRRLGGAARLHRLDEDARDDHGRSAARPRGGGLLRHLQRHAGARSRLCRGLRGRDRRQFRDDRRRPHRRGAGHGREDPVHRGAVARRCSRSPRRASASSSTCRSWR